MMFETVRMLHISCVLLALLLFVLRGWQVWRDKPITHVLWRRIIPDSVDTVLLLSGLIMMFMIGQYPFVAGWITLKLALVLVYIMLGFMAFRPDNSLRLRRRSWLSALVVFVAIVSIARLHDVGIF